VTGKKGFRAYRRCLRWEFGFSCAFCLLHEADFSEHGIGDWGLMWVEHFVPVSRSNARRNLYTNCFYACKFCNSARGNAPVADGQGPRLLNPCRDIWNRAFTLKDDEIRPLGNNPDAVYTCDTYDLNDPRKVTMRRSRREILTERLTVVKRGPRLHDRMMRRAVKSGDPTFVDDAKALWQGYKLAFADLERFTPIPHDADPRCRCGQARHRTLPRALKEQLV